MHHNRDEGDEITVRGERVSKEMSCTLYEAVLSGTVLDMIVLLYHATRCSGTSQDDHKIMTRVIIKPINDQFTMFVELALV